MAVEMFIIYGKVDVVKEHLRLHVRYRHNDTNRAALHERLRERHI